MHIMLIDREVFRIYKETHKYLENVFPRGPDYIKDMKIKKGESI